MTYRGRKTHAISFPVGGIGTGSIGLSGNGRLIDWEIFNRPNKGSVNGFSHFAVKAEQGGKTLGVKVLQGDEAAPYSGFGSPYGGILKETMSGLPHFRDHEFYGTFPMARINFTDEGFPGKVSLEAMNPFIPMEADDSSIPAAFYRIRIQNDTDRRIDYTAALSVKNPLEGPGWENKFEDLGPCRGIVFTSSIPGDLCIMTDAPDASRQEQWHRGRSFEPVTMFWKDFSRPGALSNRRHDTEHVVGEIATLAVEVTAAPKESTEARFALAWNFPDCYDYWSGDCAGGKCVSYCPPEGVTTWKNHYAVRFADCAAVGRYAFENWDSLWEQTEAFTRALHDSTLPIEVIDAVSSNISTLKSPTCLRLEDGSFYGWEGCRPDSGCCPGSCTHVWNYAYALPFLFPSLERSMRELNYRYNQHDDGGLVFRLKLPIGSPRGTFRACVDGQMGDVIKTYRDWKISGDTEWLRGLWTAVKKSIEYAWASTNKDRWDPDANGVITGRQHHTLDLELFGPSSWLNGMYLAALKAGAEMGEALGDVDAAREFQQIFAKGKEWTDTNLFNGHWYHQIVNLEDRGTLEPFATRTLVGKDVFESYWNDETGEIKWQVGEGCGVDQVLAQWHANLCGLGEILDSGQVKTSLGSIHTHNFKSMRDHFNPCRIFAVNDEKGVTICEYPDGVREPALPLLVREESMNGFEYQVACHMIQEGLVEEGLEIVAAIRDRYDGESRNPWNEFECGSNYARSMSSYSLLIAASGFRYDMTRQMIGFDPIAQFAAEGEFRCFWSIDGAWGTYRMSEERSEIALLHGSTTIRSLGLPHVPAGGEVSVNGTRITGTMAGTEIGFDEPLNLTAGETVVVEHK